MRRSLLLASVALCAAGIAHGPAAGQTTSASDTSVVRTVFGCVQVSTGLNVPCMASSATGDVMDDLASRVAADLKFQQQFVGPPGPSGPQGVPGAAFLTGVGTPASVTGNNGDSYADQSSGEVWIKAAGAWADTTHSLRGPGGSPGAPGATGQMGSPGSSVTTGATIPANSTGNNGDSFVRASDSELFQKQSGAWVDLGSALVTPGGIGVAPLTKPVAMSAANGAVTLPFAASGNAVYDLTLAGPVSIALTGGTPGQQQFLTLICRQPASGGDAVTLPTSAKYPSGVAPAISTAGGVVSMVTFMTPDGGATVFGGV